MESNHVILHKDLYLYEWYKSYEKILKPYFHIMKVNLKI